MAEYKICNLCHSPGTFDTATDVVRVMSNLRRLQDQVFTVWRCSNCYSLHSKEEIDLNYYYRNYIKLPDNYFTYIAYQNRLNLLAKHGFTKEKSLLDFGCGQGLFITFLKKKGYENVAGYDPYLLDFSYSDTLNRKYDFIVSYDVIEHVENPKKCFQQLVEKLNRDGVLTIGTPNAEGIDNSRHDLTNLHQPYHRHILSKKALLNLGLKNKLKVERVLDRSFYDTPFPGVNWRAFKYYIKQTGGFLEIVEEAPKIFTILFSPKLLFYAFAGYFFSSPDCMTIVFRQYSNGPSDSPR
jgi:2-polyprenyl-3-methyl-5-hydroxy-6-metoxy-1,4-benzoquinol methylase